ncbi:MAG: ABC transporter permease, partial [Oscillospiraceae bacterium]|nr:ABC transporter permease [Oscillospiraceae bacterium]
MKGSFFYALLEIKRRRTASFLIGLGVFIGTLSMLLLSAVGEGGSRQITAELTDTGILGLLIKRSDQSDLPGLSETELCALQSLPQVEKAAPILTVYGTVSAAGKEETCILWAATEGTEQAFSLELLEGRL